MPNRIIKESIATSESLAGVSAEAERLFWRLVVKADDFGLYYGNPKILASMCFPLNPPKEKILGGWLKELIQAGMVGLYMDDGKRYLKLLSWSKHQQTRAKKSKFPIPQEFDSTCLQSIGNQMLANVPVNVNGNGNENDKRETKTGTKSSPNGAKEIPPAFDRFWAAYPRKTNKQDALKAWKQLSPNDALVDQILAGLDRWKRCEQWTRDGGKFICYPATFLRGRRWEDEDRPEVPTAARQAESWNDLPDDFLR